MRMTLLYLIPVVLALGSLDAQQTTGSISGQVVDPAGAAIVGARVSAIGPDRLVAAHTVSDSDGRYALALDPGAYKLHFSHIGFVDVDRPLNVVLGSSESLSQTLNVASLPETVTVSAQPQLVSETPTAQTQASVSREDFRTTPAATIGEVLSLVPGVTVAQGNGPRDVSISVRGSNERQNYGVRNVQMMEDGFPVTQPDGMGRTDLTDPHAYSSIDVIEGPSSALYGNYATGGAVNFHTRTGGEIRGFEVGSDFGSFGYFNDHADFGIQGENYEASVFVSDVGADLATSNSGFNTITANVLGSFDFTPRDRFTFKFIDNDLDADLSIRLSLLQYRANPYQKGCDVLASAAAGCASISVFANGFNGAKQSLTAAQAGLGRHDRRTIAGARWEHHLSDETVWRTQFVFDNRDVNQPTSATSFRGTYPSFNVISDVSRHGAIAGLHGTSYLGGFFNYLNITYYNFNLIPGGQASLGGQTSNVFGKHMNAGFRARQELALAERITLVGGIGTEFTSLQALESVYAYPSGSMPSTTRISVDRTIANVAPEVALQIRASDAWLLHARFGTGYGTPQATQLFVTPQGVNGNNTHLQTQTNRGIDFGAQWTPGPALQASVTGFYEWFHNEMVSQSPGVNLQSYTFNAPASEHHGVEAGVDWHPMASAFPGLRLRGSYMFDRQLYTNYAETITSGSKTASFNRDGLMIPGIVPNFLNGRIVYDHATGSLRGLGGFVEAAWRDNYQIDNANLLAASGYTLWNLSTHYDPPAGHRTLSRLRFYVDVQNLTNRVFVGSANNLTDSLNTTTGTENPASVLAAASGSIYAGAPRSTFGGVRVRF